MLIGVDELLPLPGANRDRDDLLGEDAVLLCSDRALVRRHREFVLFLARYAVLATQVLCRLEHAARHRVVTATGSGAPAGEAVVHLDATPGTAPPHVGRIEGDIAHALRAARDDEFVVPTADLETRLDDRLQTRSTPTVDLHAGNGHGQAGIQCDHTADCRRLAVGVAVSEDHVADRLEWDTGPFEQSLQRGDPQVHGGQRFEHAAVAADRRPDRFANHNFAQVHTCLPPVTSRTVPVMYDDRSLARNNATLATSSGSPARPMGTSANF